jgi:hypothetical protein
MRINKQMHLGTLAELMGACATIEEAAIMRDLLAAERWENTEDIPDDEWESMADIAVMAANR